MNRALSAANACLYGLCHAAIVATGFSPGLGFVHTGKLLSFVYDVADLYKVEVTVPVAFQVVREGVSKIETRARKACREAFVSAKLLERIMPDMQRAVGLLPEKSRFVSHRGPAPAEAAVEEGMGEGPGALWNPDGTRTEGGRNFGGPLLGVPAPAPDDDDDGDDDGDGHESAVDEGEGADAGGAGDQVGGDAGGAGGQVGGEDGEGGGEEDKVPF